MKIVHTGDIHIGSALKNLPPDKARLRRTEITAAFLRLCVFARENGVSAVLIAGDLFDTDTSARSLQKEVLSAVAAAKPVCFFYVSGNHDASLLDGADLPENFYRFSKARGFCSYDLPENVSITGMDARYFSDETFSTLSLRPDKFNVVLLHGDISDPRAKEGVPLAALQNRYVDYLALGHIHKPDLVALRLDNRGKYRYCGCLESRGFDETGARGFFLLDVGKDGIREEKFLSVASREAVEKRVDISACESYFDVENAVLGATKDIDGKNMLKATLCGRYKEGLRKDIKTLEKRLASRFFHVKTADESRLALDLSACANDRSERAEFIREVGRYALTDAQRDEILEVGLKALMGEEIDL